MACMVPLTTAKPKNRVMDHGVGPQGHHILDLQAHDDTAGDPGHGQTGDAHVHAKFVVENDCQRNADQANDNSCA